MADGKKPEPIKPGMFKPEIFGDLTIGMGTGQIKGGANKDAGEGKGLNPLNPKIAGVTSAIVVGDFMALAKSSKASTPPNEQPRFPATANLEAMTEDGQKVPLTITGYIQRVNNASENAVFIPSELKVGEKKLDMALGAGGYSMSLTDLQKTRDAKVQMASVDGRSSDLKGSVLGERMIKAINSNLKYYDKDIQQELATGQGKDGAQVVGTGPRPGEAKGK